MHTVHCTVQYKVYNFPWNEIFWLRVLIINYNKNWGCATMFYSYGKRRRDNAPTLKYETICISESNWSFNKQYVFSSNGTTVFSLKTLSKCCNSCRVCPALIIMITCQHSLYIYWISFFIIIIHTVTHQNDLLHHKIYFK